ncbi:alpha/beta fold hydrolase [Mycobacterium sp. Aquia_216]|uniref:alpha/beta fold hydrolase n=1 Tax=Mycobacterium sp. Aquia_216 TaxID=2991729 RepID=UPI00227D3B39|nr:alpha/beta fold hydrolase [Mycobacterium sp. Aquia_216]WAJ44830.1 alpha/beta fold hydrolase [Mycobacterium sp. Aquia_216]
MTAESAWQEVIPHLCAHHEVSAPNAVGHPGGPAEKSRPVRIGEFVDTVEQHLNDYGLGRPHLAGNSLGGYIAIELARRGRAVTVCAFSPAAFWTADDGLQAQLLKKFKIARTIARITRSLSPLVMSSAHLH